MKRLADLPPVWALLAAGAAWGLARVLPVWSFSSGLGVPVIAAGGALMLWSAWWFRRKRTAIEPRRAPRALIVEGPYRLNRNPIYSGITLVLVGIALTLGALSALVPAALYPVLITHRFIRDEEAALRAAFGADAEAYFARTRRW